MIKKDLPDLIRRMTEWRRGQPEAEVVKFVEDVFGCYLAADDNERRLLRNAVHSHLWNVRGDDDICMYLAYLARNKDTKAGAIRHLRAWIAAVSLTGGCADWRDTIVLLGEQRRRAEAQGIDTKNHFEELAESAESGESHGVSGMSTRDLIRSAGELRNVSGPQQPVQSPCNAVVELDSRRPWWRFWS